MLIVYIISAIIFLVVFYLLINRAVFYATKDHLNSIQDSLRLNNQLKILELKKNGTTDAEIQKQIDFVYKKDKQ